MRQIKSALETSHVVLCAPGGYGKSVALRTLTHQRPHTYYFALTPSDVDLTDLQCRIRSILENPKNTLVLDDVHYLDVDDDARQWLGQLLAAPWGSCANLILSGRRLEIAELGLLLAQGKVTRFSQKELAFRQEESKALGVTEDWHRRTEGWPLALALGQQIGDHRLDELDPTVPNQQLFDKLAHSLFAGLPAELHRFLQLSAVPLRINVELAANLTGSTPAEASTLLHEVLQRNLFLEASEPRGWFRYHDLIRDYLLRQFDPTPTHEIAINWFEAHNDLPLAIEQALDGKLYPQTAALLLRLPRTYIWENQRQRTLRRWVTSLPQNIRAAYPLLQARLARELLAVTRGEEVWLHLGEALGFAEANSDRHILAEVQLALAYACYHDGQWQRAIMLCREVIHQLDPQAQLQRLAYSLLANSLATSGDYRAARAAYLRALTFPQDEFSRLDHTIRNNMTNTVLLPLGEYGEAQAMLTLNQAKYAEKNAERIWYLMAWAGFYEGIGDWAGLATSLDEIRAIEASSEQADEDDIYYLWWRALLHVGRSEFVQAEVLLTHASGMLEDNGERVLCIAMAKAWLLRRQGHFVEAQQVVNETLAGDWDAKLYRGVLASEGEMSRFQAKGESDQEANFPALHPEIQRLIALRARTWLLRLRALLALRCYRSGERRWRIHLNSVLRTTKHYGYSNILITREPDLGAQFWVLCIEEGIALDQATSALKVIGRNEHLIKLLRHSSPAVRANAVHALAAIGDETTIPTLAEVLTSEKDANVRNSLENVLDQLEAQPPPRLRVTMLGEFSATRGDKPITAEDWQRPAARRLFQYFVLNQGKTLPRDRILEDLWPDSAPDAARSSFKTVYSWLRKAIEPYLRPKSPSRYIMVDQETYTFNPQKSTELLNSDVTEFELTVRMVLKAADDYDVRPLPPNFVAALEGWKPLLPELSFEAWTLEARERLLNLYVQGCLYAVSAMLDVDKAIDAALWAERALTLAPWSEEAWQGLIRAQARQGNRSLALKSYEAAVTALKRELDVPPSALLEWLARRLRADEQI